MELFLTVTGLITLLAFTLAILALVIELKEQGQ
jgi:hypothetical protein